MSDPTPTADLNVFLSSPVDGQYHVDLRYFQADDPTEKDSAGRTAIFNFTDLLAKSLNPEAYGESLRQAVFGETTSTLSSYYTQALANAVGAGQELRVRILIDRSARKLQDLRWETLRVPSGGAFLALNANQPFSRFLSSEDWQRIELCSRANLRALIFVANPNDLAEIDLPNGQPLAEVPVAGEIQRAQEGLVTGPQGQGIQEVPALTVIASDPHTPGLATFEALKASLGKGFDILYLVCHGALIHDKEHRDLQQPFLLLEMADGTSDMRKASELVEYVRNLPAALRPRLAVLASCQSGGQGKVPREGPDEDERSYDRGALAALGPRLVEAGIPAVVAQQDDIQMATIRQFTPAFFSELLRSGQVDKAMAVARSLIRDERDWWVPVLYLRLRGGRLWFKSGYANEGNLNIWKGIKTNLKGKNCTPVLGSGMSEFLTGSARTIAARWAKENSYPFERHHQEELHQVAEYLDLAEGEDTLYKFLYQLFADELKQRFPDSLPVELATIDTASIADIGELSNTCIRMISAIGAARRSQNEYDPYKVLSRLQLPIYITANADCLLEDAIREQHNEPQSLYFCWKQALITPEATETWKKLESPTPKRPLVYHLFGRLDQPQSLVLTEDDYFDYLMSINRSEHPLGIPDSVVLAWKQNVLLFLGFQMTDWNFRLLFRSILTEERRKVRPDIRSVAVQLQPGDDNLRPASARHYLERYFGEKFNIYWGSAEDYLRDLARQL